MSSHLEVLFLLISFNCLDLLLLKFIDCFSFSLIATAHSSSLLPNSSLDSIEFIYLVLNTLLDGVVALFTVVNIIY